ncbi:hypothetical protein Scep_017463 [Stephania cephalantha]|uniref:Uncharacterized protein n=1 Tax=Stephania cephalantha TaxID=152367 RepID=A0AAP0IQI0_9MAGN
MNHDTLGHLNFCIGLYVLIKNTSVYQYSSFKLTITMPRDRDPLVVGRVTGDVVDPFERCVTLRVIYGNREITNGCDLRPSAVVNQPAIEIGGNDTTTLYTLEKRSYPMSAHNPRLEFIGLYSCYSGNKLNKRSMHRGGVKTSTQETSESFTI